LFDDGHIIYISFDYVVTGRESGNQVDNKVAATKIKEDTKPPPIPMGNWTTGSYVDEFGDKTGKGYVVLKSSRTFSNSATTGSALSVKMFINSGARDPWFRLYEYVRNNPVISTRTVWRRSAVPF